ncbi:MAG: hypothetical protein WDM78_20620 [Puia sp.]
MERNITQQEVLLNTDTQFAHRQWADKDSKGSESLSAIEKLEKACWDGLVKELIPELDITLVPHKKLWLGRFMKHVHFSPWIFMNIPGLRKNMLP